MNNRRRLAVWFVLGAVFMLNGGAISRAQTSAPAAPPAPSEEELLQPGKAAFDAEASGRLDVKKARTGHLLVRPIVNGEAAGWFIFDTGAGIDCVTSSSVADLGLDEVGDIDAVGGGSEAKATVYRARDLTLGPLHCAGHPLMAVDLDFLEQHLGDKVSGIIGFGVLSRCVAVIDLQQSAISLNDPERYELPRGAWTALDLSERVPVITAVFEGHEGRFLLDTGDHGHLVFNEPAVRKWALLEGRAVTDTKLGGVGGFVAAKSGTIAKLELAGLTLKDVPASFALEAKGTHAQTNRDGRIGAGVLQRFMLAVDYGRQRMALLPRNEDAGE